MSSDKGCIHVVGAGFAGLTTAFALSEAGLKVRVYEAKPRVGGLLGTHRSRFGIAETAANGILSSKHLEDMADKISVRLLSTNRASNKRFIYRNGLRRWPLGPLETLPFVIGALRMLLRKLGGQKVFSDFNDLSVGEWMSQRLGPATARYLVSPALKGIYASDSFRLSSELVLGRFKSVDKGKLRGTVAPQGGMNDLIRALTQYLENAGVEFVKEKTIESLDDLSQTNSNQKVVLACGFSSMKRILKSSLKRSEFANLFESLDNVTLLPLVSLTLFFPKDRKYKAGFGCLFPDEENFFSLGVLFNQHIFAERSEFQSETWIAGGVSHPEVVSLNPAELLDKVLRDRLRLWKVDADPLHYDLSFWPEALPLYDSHLLNALSQLSHLPSNVFLNGNYMGRIGLQSILERSFFIAEQIVNKKD